jgi:putative endonuclease
MSKYCYVYVLRSASDHRFYVGLTPDLIKRLQAHNQGLVNSTKTRRPFGLVYWEGCLNESDAAKREKYLKTAWGKRYVKTRLRTFLTNSSGGIDKNTS